MACCEEKQNIPSNLDLLPGKIEKMSPDISDSGACSSDEELPEDHMDAYKKYRDQVVSSGGFDVDHCPKLLGCTLAPVTYLSDERYRQLCRFSKLALNQFNLDHATNYEFFKYVKATWLPCGGVKYYITFEAKEDSGHAPTTFQALVYDGIPKRDGTEVVKVKFIREKSSATTKDNRILLGCGN